MGLWGKLCVFGCVSSVAALKVMEAIFYRTRDEATFPIDPFVATLYLLLISIVLGIVAVTRRGTGRLIPAAAIILVFLVVPAYVLMSFGEIPMLTAGIVMKFAPVSYLVLAVALAGALALRYSLRGGRNLLADTAGWARAEWRKPNRVVAFLVLLVVAFVLPGPLLVGAYLIMLGLVAILWKLGALFWMR